MTIRHAAAAAAIGWSLATGAVAQDFRGAEISAEFLAFTEDRSFGETQYRGAVEFGIWDGFGAAADFSFHGWRAFDTDGRNLTLHAFGDLMGWATVGGFYGRDSFDGDGANLYGVEAATDLAGAEVQGALGYVDSEDGTGMLLLAEGRYGLGDFGVTGFAGHLSGDLDATRVAFGGDYALGFGPTVYGELGRFSTEGFGETYVTVGARIAIGPRGGTTFGSRSVFSVIPGF
ncbi:hypothetical protein [Rubellimicrobium sp. CFH 75288]|uniref:hypothetical protein n=1 Tax=Rubellimicrobium sp. CFH 75288 TaxID=2697034 RepID=UPI00141362D3|nr:hypothetical protein [Rubellimicrobium sp. CFH 75288]NAZ36953.1 hypothetical protein [Rubellimicrobium sp. CFH 75288]